MSKDASQVEFESSQLCLPGTSTRDIVAGSDCTVCTCSKGIATPGFIFCEDAPWICPNVGPPMRNTGVHVPK